MASLLSQARATWIHWYYVGSNFEGALALTHGLLHSPLAERSNTVAVRPTIRVHAQTRKRGPQCAEELSVDTTTVHDTVLLDE